LHQLIDRYRKMNSKLSYITALIGMHNELKIHGILFV
jgi:hypothetical protein